MLQACLNGGRSGDLVPVTPAAMAADALAVAVAGAETLHLHPRDRVGEESLVPDVVAACLGAVRESVPEIGVGIGTGAWIAPGGRARQADIAAWTVRPDFASVNLGEADAPEVIALLRGMGIGIEAGLWSLDDAGRFLAEVDPDHCLRILIEIPDIPPAQAFAEADAILRLLDGVCCPILLHGEGQSAWPLIARAAALGLDTRVGFEDVLVLPDGSPASENAALVAAANDLIYAARSA